MDRRALRDDYARHIDKVNRSTDREVNEAVAKLFDQMASRQQRLDPEIEAAIFKNVESLYEA